MKIAVAGGTGLVGRHLLRALEQAGHDSTVISRSAGADAYTGDGLRDALTGADAVIDVTNTASLDLEESANFFTTVTKNLLAAEADLGIGHHVLLSIVGIDRVEKNPHYRAKLRQERAAASGTVSLSILRATQFFEFAEMVVSWTRDGDTALIPPLLIQPVAAADVAAQLAQLATAPPLNHTMELAGPRREDLVDMTRRILAVRGEQTQLVPTWHVRPFDTDMAGDVLLPSADAATTATDVATWLASE